MTPEFDSYAPEYRDLLHDPIRDRFANGSQFFHRRKAVLIHDFLARLRMSVASMAWLDVGCGQGELLKIAGSAFARAVGCDPSAKMMEACAGIEMFEQLSPSELPFPDQSFDFITAVCVYHHVPCEQRAALTASIYRVLKPGGVFCLIEHNPFNPVTQIIVRRCPVDSDAELLTASTASGAFATPAGSPGSLGPSVPVPSVTRCPPRVMQRRDDSRLHQDAPPASAAAKTRSITRMFAIASAGGVGVGRPSRMAAANSSASTAYGSAGSNLMTWEAGATGGSPPAVTVISVGRSGGMLKGM